jgi:hypothetical protein
LLTTPNPDENKDLALFEKLGINASGRLVEDSSETAAA